MDRVSGSETRMVELTEFGVAFEEPSGWTELDSVPGAEVTGVRVHDGSSVGHSVVVAQSPWSRLPTPDEVDSMVTGTFGAVIDSSIEVGDTESVCQLLARPEQLVLFDQWASSSLPLRWRVMAGRYRFASGEELNAFLYTDRPPTDDDVWIDGDGTRIDTRERFLAMVERDRERRRERSAAAGSEPDSSDAR